MGIYREDRAWSDKFIPAMKQIIGPFLLEPSSFDLDSNDGFDGGAWSIMPWWILDLNVFRRALNFHMAGHKKIRVQVKSNNDGTNLAAYDILSFHPQLVVASSREKVGAA